MPSAQVGDLAIYYEEHGQGKPILLQHGLGGSTQHWRSTIGPLQDLGYRVIAFDQRGHGRSSDGTKSCTIRQLAADIHGLIDHLGLQRATLMGHSIGGRAMLLFAIEHPDRVEALILNCAMGSAPGGDVRTTFEQFADTAKKQGMEAGQNT